MSRKQESLRELVESRAAWHGRAPLTLWRWTLNAIVQNALVPGGLSLDAEFNWGGMPLTWRRVIAAALARIDRVNPSTINWTSEITIEPAVFDKWLDIQLQVVSSSKSSLQLPVRRRRSPAEVRRWVEKYVNEERAAGRNINIRRMWKVVQEKLPGATRPQAITALQRIEGGAKPRGRPRAPVVES
jgi:hypothetical protein